MQWYEPEVRHLEDRLAEERSAVPLAAADGRRRPVFYGSSTLRLWHTLAEDLRCPGAINLGFGGSTLEACVYFFDRLVQPANPGSLIVYAGENDLGDGKTPDQVLRNFRQLARKVAERFPQIPFAYISIKPTPNRYPILDRIERTNTAIQREIEMRGNILYISVFEAMLDSGKRPKSDLFLDDGLHLSPEGYRLWTQLLSRDRERLFNPRFVRCEPVSPVNPGRDEKGVSQMVQSPAEP